MLLLHGDNTLASRQHFSQLKSTASNLVSFSSTPDLTAVIQSLESNTLFGDTRTVFLEKPFSQKSSFSKLFTDYLKTTKPANLIIWEDRPMTPTITKLFPPADVQLFKISRALYAFLENLSPGKPAPMITNYLNTLQQEPVELVMYYLFSQLRQLIQSKDNCLPSRVPGFIRSKLTRQASRFTTNHLLELHRKLYLIDKGNKTGTLHHSLETAIENWLWTI